jgi:hypothetical protein
VIVPTAASPLSRDTLSRCADQRLARHDHCNVVAVMTKLYVLVLLAACGDDLNMTPDAGARDDAPADVPANRIMMAGTVRDLDLTKPITPTDQAVLDGVEACVIVPGEAKRCMTTGSDGRWQFDMPKLRKGISLTLSKPGYSPLDNVSSTLDADELGFDMYLGRDADVGAFMQHFQATYPLGAKAGIMMAGFHHVAPNYVFLDGATASASAGTGPFYMSSPWQYTDNQVTTSTTGLGYAVFSDVDPAQTFVDVTVKLAGTTCFASRDAAPLVGEDTIRFPIISGFFTHLPIVCE